MLAAAFGAVEIRLVPGGLLFAAAGVAGAQLLAVGAAAVGAEEIGAGPGGGLFLAAVLAGAFLFLADQAHFLGVLIQEDRREVVDAGRGQQRGAGSLEAERRQGSRPRNTELKQRGRVRSNSGADAQTSIRDNEMAVLPVPVDNVSRIRSLLLAIASIVF